MENSEVKALIESFKGYRDLLVPVQKNLTDFIETYDAMRGNIDKLNAALGGDLKGKLEDILRQMSGQTEKASNLSSQIDKLASSANKYASEVGAMVAIFAKIEERLTAVNAIDARAAEQVSRLDAILEEKTKSYNLKELQKALDVYNQDVRKVSEFINKDVAVTLLDSQKKLEGIRGGISEIVKNQNDEKMTLGSLLESYASSNELLRKITEKQDLNEAYIFDIIDRWAESRRVKTRG